MLHNPLTPQQRRLQQLAESRAWGSFSQSEVAAIHSEAPKKRREATPPDFTPYIRWVPAGINYDSLKTIAMEGE